MDEIALLRRVRADVPAPSPAALADARHRLDLAAARATDGPRASAHPSRRRGRIGIAATAAVAAVGAGVLVLGPWPGAQQPATAAEVLRDASSVSRRVPDTVTRPGQFVRVQTREVSLGYVTGDSTGEAGEGGDGVLGAYVTRLVQTTWVPHERGDTWVREAYSTRPDSFYGGPVVRRAAARDFAVSATADDPVTERAAGGLFGNGELGGGPSPGSPDQLDGLPRDPSALLARLADGPGGSSSRSEEVMSQVSAFLRTGVVPHDLRAAMYDALALLPDVVVTDDQAALDGRRGTAIGVRIGDVLHEVVIDPESGEYLGQRDTQLDREGAVPAGTVVDSTAVRVSVVDAAP